MEILANIYNGIMSFTAWMWSLPVVLILIGGGLIITVACDFVQIKHFGFMLKKLSAVPEMETIGVETASPAFRQWLQLWLTRSVQAIS